MSSFETRGTDDASVVRFFPAFDADAPVIAWLQAGEAVFGAWGDQVIADRRLMPQELIAELDANRMLAQIIRTCIAFAVAIKAGEWIGAASLQSCAQNVLYHYLLGYLNWASGIL